MGYGAPRNAVITDGYTLLVPQSLVSLHPAAKISKFRMYSFRVHADEGVSSKVIQHMPPVGRSY